MARDGQEALEAILRDRPDLVLLDVMMPGKSGFEVCQEVRADDAVKGTPILMLTAKGRDTDIAKGLALGADAYMTKPFSTRELAQKVREMLERGRLKRRRGASPWLIAGARRGDGAAGRGRRRGDVWATLDAAERERAGRGPGNARRWSW